MNYRLYNARRSRFTWSELVLVLVTMIGLAVCFLKLVAIALS